LAILFSFNILIDGFALSKLNDATHDDDEKRQNEQANLQITEYLPVGKRFLIQLYQ